MSLLRAFSFVAWAAMMWVSVHAITAMGAGAAGDVFFADFAHPWRAQFNADFTVHLLLMALWIGYREKRLTRAVPFALAAVFLGGAFSFAYLFVATLTARGDARRLLLGDRAQVEA